MVTAVEGDVDATVIAVDDVLRIVGVDPDVVVVHVNVVLGNGSPSGTAIGAFQEGDSSDHHPVLITGIHRDQSEIVAVTVADFIEAFFVGAFPPRSSASLAVVFPVAGIGPSSGTLQRQ